MELNQKKVAILGAGNMGLALLKGLLESKTLSPEQICVKNKRVEKTNEIAQTYGVRVARSCAECVEGADIVLLAVKPQILVKVLEEVRSASGRALFLSVAAGTSTATIEHALGGKPRVVRAMPNTPALIREGATAIAAGAFADEADLACATTIFQQIGLVVTVEEEHLDAVTGLSGSGPAYIMLMIEAFADAGVKVGLSREIAMKLAVQTMAGSARLLQATGQHPGVLKDQVTSPGGTAIAGLHTLEEGGLRTTIINAVERATMRARELGARSRQQEERLKSPGGG